MKTHTERERERVCVCVCVCGHTKFIKYSCPPPQFPPFLDCLSAGRDVYLHLREQAATEKVLKNVQCVRGAAWIGGDRDLHLGSSNKSHTNVHLRYEHIEGDNVHHGGDIHLRAGQAAKGEY